MAERLAALLSELFASGRIIDVVLGLVACETVALLAWRRSRGSGPAPAALIATIASGACLMLALRAALTGAGWMPIAGLLLASLAAHVADLCLRFGHGQERNDRSASRGDPRIRPHGTSATSDTLPARRKAGIISLLK